jgi:hypothetical protein
MGIYSNELIAAHYKALAEKHRTSLRSSIGSPLLP